MKGPHLVRENAALAVAAARCRAAGRVAVDTEFARSDTFYPRLALVQLAGDGEIWLVDPLADLDLAPLAELLADPGVEKVFHSASEDLEVLRHALGVVPAPLFDTQVAAAIAGLGFSRGYGALVAELLGVSLDKGETRSDWLRRPLSAAQLRYAADDVRYLLDLAGLLEERLAEAGRSPWLAEEMAALVAAAQELDPPAEAWRRVRGAERLTGVELARLQALAAWREEEARRLDRPRGRVVPDRVLLALARERPRERRALAAVEGMTPGILRRHGDALLALLRRDLPPVATVPPRTLDAAERARYERLRARLSAVAQSLEVAPELLARRAELERLAAGDGLSPRLARGWRHVVVGRALLAELAEGAEGAEDGAPL
ncbi:MAG: ribonuclease D [Porticoccaceae bacterium]|nr:MAG: ribonuclease D [Porticoccaceae bacterium]